MDTTTTSENTERVVTHVRPDVLDDVEELRLTQGLSRAAYLRMAIHEKIRNDRVNLNERTA